MQFFKNLVERVSSNLTGLKQRLITNLPFRIAIGRFGILLMDLGRFLQVRYANWNSEFRLQSRASRDSLVRYCSIDVSEMVTSRAELTFNSPSAQPRERTPMVDALFAIKGVKGVTLHPYHIYAEWSSVFTDEEILPKIEQVILEHLTKKQTKSAA